MKKETLRLIDDLDRFREHMAHWAAKMPDEGSKKFNMVMNEYAWVEEALRGFQNNLKELAKENQDTNREN